jgi:hypothetical protein
MPDPCTATSGDFYCTLDAGHTGPHEAWTCTCGTGGRCASEPNCLVLAWT